jgi:hypothetical protein
VESKKVEVLPDMEGVSAEFDLDELFATDFTPLDQASLEQGLTLTVWTRNGADSSGLRLLGSRKPALPNRPASCSAIAPVAPATDDDRSLCE